MANERKMRICAMSYRRVRYPSVRLRGMWVSDYGFGVGDQVTITNPEEGVLIMRVTKTCEEVEEERARRTREIQRFKKKRPAA